MRRGVLQALDYGFLLLQFVPLEGLIHSPFGGNCGEKFDGDGDSSVSRGWGRQEYLRGRRSHTSSPYLFSTAVDADLNCSVKGKCFFCLKDKPEELGVGDMPSRTLNYVILISQA